jgi:hypothetical protein
MEEEKQDETHQNATKQDDKNEVNLKKGLKPYRSKLKDYQNDKKIVNPRGDQ